MNREMSQDLASAMKLVEAERLKALSYEFLKIPSLTGQEKEFGEHYARHLKNIGMEVEIDRELPDSPSVIGRLSGTMGAGPTLQFDGHTDVIHIPHSPPELKGDVIYGRGSSDMKSSLAAYAEVARILKELGNPFKGTLMITAHGLHESPVGHGEALESLLKRGIHGDACVVGEVADDFVPVVGKGQTTFEYNISRDGDPVHETWAKPGTVNPLDAGYELLKLFEEKRAEIKEDVMEYVGSESIFVGIFQGGDFFNRVPTTCKIMGTRRFSTKRTEEEIDRELGEMADKVAEKTGAGVELKTVRTAEAFIMEKDDPIVTSLRGSYQIATGKELPLGGVSIVGDGSKFINIAGIPTVYHGIDGSTAHSDLEYIHLDDFVRATKVYLGTALNFLQ